METMDALRHMEDELEVSRKENSRLLQMGKGTSIYFSCWQEFLILIVYTVTTAEEDNYVKMREEAEQKHLNDMQKLKQDFQMSMRVKERQRSHEKKCFDRSIAAANTHIMALAGNSDIILDFVTRCFTVILPHADEKEDLRRYFVYSENHLIKVDHSNMILKNANKELSEKLHLSSIEKEHIERDLTKQQEKAMVNDTPSQVSQDLLITM